MSPETNHNNEGDQAENFGVIDAVEIASQTIPATTDFSVQPVASYSTPQYSMENKPLSNEAFELRFEDISQEELALLRDVLDISDIAREKGASQNAQVSSVATAFAVTPSETGATSEDGEKTTPFLQSEANEVSFFEKIGARGKAFLAVLSVAASFGIATQASAREVKERSFEDTVRIVVGQGQAVYNKAERLGVDQRKIASLQLQIEKIENQKTALLQQGEAKQQLGETEGSVNRDLQPKILAAQYEAQKATFAEKIASAEDRYLKISNPTPTDEARYNRERALIEADKLRAQGAYEIQVAKSAAKRGDTQVQIESQSSSIQERIQKMTLQQEALAAQIRQLEVGGVVKRVDLGADLFKILNKK